MTEKNHTYVLNNETAELAKDPRKFILRNSGFLFIFCTLVAWPVAILLSLMSDFISFDLYFILSLSLPHLLMLILFFAFVYGYHLMNITGFKKPEWRSTFLSVPVMLSVYPMMLYVSILFSYLAPKSSFEVSGNAESSLLSLGPIASYLLLAVLPAIVEELICRGLIFGAFRQRSAGLAIIMSSICFALLHCNLEQAVYTFIFGLFVAIVREFTGSIYPGMLMHGFLNSISVTSIFFGDQLLGASSESVNTTEITESVAEPVFNNFSDFFVYYSEIFILAMFGMAVAILLLFFIRKFSNYEKTGVDKTVPAMSITYIVGCAICLFTGIVSALL